MTDPKENHKSQKKAVLDTCKWFLNFTTSEGITQVRESDNGFSKWAWSLLSAIMFALTIYAVVSSVHGYFQYANTTKIRFIGRAGQQTNVKFPSVTICNSNRVHCGHLYEMIRNCTEVSKLL